MSDTSMPKQGQTVYAYDLGKLRPTFITSVTPRGNDYAVTVFGILGSYPWQVLQGQQEGFQEDYQELQKQLSKSTHVLVD